MLSELPQKKCCSQCGGEVPAGFGFCGMCGAKLDTAPLFSKDSRERRLLETDITEAVADRLIKWGKTVGWFFLAASAVLFFSIGIWGVKSWSDVMTDLKGAAARAKADAGSLKKQVDSSASDAADLSKKYKALNGDLDRYRQVNQSIERLQKELQNVTIAVADVKSSTDVNQAVARAFAANDLSKVIVWLKAMGVAIADNAPKDQVEAAYRQLGAKTLGDPAFRQKYFTEAQKAGLIQ